MPKFQDVLSKYSKSSTVLDSSLGGDETQPIVDAEADPNVSRTKLPNEVAAQKSQWLDKEGLKRDLAEVKKSYKAEWQLCLVMVLGLYLILLATIAINILSSSFIPLLSGLTIAGASAPFLINKMFTVVREERDTERLLFMAQNMDTATLKDIVLLMNSQKVSKSDS